MNKSKLWWEIHSNSLWCSIFPLGESLWEIQYVILHAEIMLLLNSTTISHSSRQLGNDSRKQVLTCGSCTGHINRASLQRLQHTPELTRYVAGWPASWGTGKGRTAIDISEQHLICWTLGCTEPSWRHSPVFLPSLTPQLKAFQALDSRIYTNVLQGSTSEWSMFPECLACRQPIARLPALYRHTSQILSWAPFCSFMNITMYPATAPFLWWTPSDLIMDHGVPELAMVHGTLLYRFYTWESQGPKEVRDFFSVTQPINI